jgi:hypothetical protein
MKMIHAYAVDDDLLRNLSHVFIRQEKGKISNA